MHPHPGESGQAGTVPAFLAKLWRLVEDPETNHLIYWNSLDGRSFVIQNQAQFARELLPLNYKHNNMASFIRQLNMYGFHKITSLDNGGLKFDRDEMEFSHPFFQRGHPFMLENIKRKIAHARGHASEEKVLATTTQPAAVVKPETLNRVLTEVKVMRGKQEVLDNRFSEMKQENEALWREVVMLRQKHMKQQQIVNKLIQFLVTIVQPSGRGNMGMKRRLPLMLNDAPSASKTRKTTSSLEIQSLADSEYDDDDDDDEYVNLMGGLEQPIVFQQANMVPASSSTRGMISEIPNTPSSTRSHHDELEDIDDIIEEEAPEEDVNKIFEELSEATSTATTPAQVVSANGGGSASAVPVSVAQPPQVSGDNVAANQEFLRIEDPAATSSASRVADQSKGIEQPKKTWYANKDGFISAEIPTDLFDEQSQSSTAGALVDANVNPTLSEDLTMKIKQEADETKKPKKFNGAHLQLARLPSNTGDVFSLSTPEDFTMHLENVQSDLNTLKGLLATNDQYSYDPSHLAGTGGPSPIGSLSFNPNLLMADGEFVPDKMFDDSNILIPYQLSGDCLGVPAAGGSSDETTSKEDAEKQLLQYNPTLDFSELLDTSLDDAPLSTGRNYSTSSNLDCNGSLNTPQP